EKDGRRNDPRTLSLFWSTKNKNVAEALTLAQEEKKKRGDIATDDALAWALYRNKKYAEAKAASDRALAHKTRDARLMYHAGAIRSALNDAGAERKLIEEALKQNPEFDMTGAQEARALIESK